MEITAKVLLRQAKLCAKAVAKWPKAKRDTITLKARQDNDPTTNR